MGLVLSSVYSPSVNELLPPARSSFHSREYVYFRKSSPYLFKAAHSLLACLECSIGASVSISAVDSLPLERLAPGLVSSSVRVERSSFLSDGNANLEYLYALC